MSDMKYFDGSKWVTMKGDDGCDPQVTARVSKVVTLPAGSNASGKVTVAGVACEPDLNFEFSIPQGADGIGTDGTDGTDGKGWTGGSYDSSTGIVTFASDDGLGFVTGDLRGADGIGTDGTDGTDGKGWTGGSYSDSTGIVTFTSDDGLEFTTGDLRGADGVGTNGTDGKGWTGGSYSDSTGVVTFASDDGLGFVTGDLRGADGVGTNGTDGKGWTGGSYNASNGIVTFTSDDGLGFVTGDLRGSDGVGSKGDKGDGWTGGSYNASNGIVTFTSDDGLGFVTGDLRGGQGGKGTDGKGWTGGSYNASNGIVTFTSDDGLGFVTGDLRGKDGVGTNGTDGKGWTGGSYNASNGIVTFTSDDGLGFSTEDLRGSDGQNGGDGTVPIQTGGRLSLTADSPIMSSDVVSDTIHYVPYSGDTVSLYDSTASQWVGRRLTGAVSLSVASLTANTVHDVFLGSNGTSWAMACVPWANDSDRNSELALVDGILVSPSDNALRYVGTIRTNGAGQVEATEINYCIWNAYNQVKVEVSTRFYAPWGYQTGAWVSYGGSSTNGEARVSFVTGLASVVSMKSNQNLYLGYGGVWLGPILNPSDPNSFNRTAANSTGGYGASSAFLTQTSPGGYNYVQSISTGAAGGGFSECSTYGEFLA